MNGSQGLLWQIQVFHLGNIWQLQCTATDTEIEWESDVVLCRALGGGAHADKSRPKRVIVANAIAPLMARVWIRG